MKEIYVFNHFVYANFMNCDLNPLIKIQVKPWISIAGTILNEINWINVSSIICSFGSVTCSFLFQKKNCNFKRVYLKCEMGNECSILQ